MGFNTVLVVLNDALDLGAKDSRLGLRIQEAARSWYGRRSKFDLSFFARSERGASGSYGEVISSDHADSTQVVIVHGNTGWRLDDPDLPEACLKSLEWQLKELKRRAKAKATTPNQSDGRGG